jgi:hypothetical protein
VGGRLDPEGWAATPRGRFVSCSVRSPRAKFGCHHREGARREWKLLHSSQHKIPAWDGSSARGTAQFRVLSILFQLLRAVKTTVWCNVILALVALSLSTTLAGKQIVLC